MGVAMDASSKTIRMPHWMATQRMIDVGRLDDPDRSNTNSSTALVPQGGVRVAKMHPHDMTGYKAPNSYGFKPVFEDRTTARLNFNKKPSYGSPKILCTYHPDSHRNRMPVKPSIITPKEAAFLRSKSQIVLGKDFAKDKRRFNTTNKLREKYLSKMDTLIDNQGINSDRTRWIHHIINIS